MYLRLYTAGDGADLREISIPKMDSSHSISTDTSSSGRLITTTFSSKLTNSEQPTTVNTKQEVLGMCHIYIARHAGWWKGSKKINSGFTLVRIADAFWQIWYILKRLPVQFSDPQEQTRLLPCSYAEMTLPGGTYKFTSPPTVLNIHKYTLHPAKQTEQNQTHVHIRRYVFREESTPRLFFNFKSQ